MRGALQRSSKSSLGFTGCSALVVASLLISSSCLVGPKYQRPKVDAPAAFRGAESAVQRASFADLPWWEIFHDETLKGLVKTALANNYDLGVAVTRVEQARQVAAEARAQYFPAIKYQTQISGGKNQFVPPVPLPSPVPSADSFWAWRVPVGNRISGAAFGA